MQLSLEISHPVQQQSLQQPHLRCEHLHSHPMSCFISQSSSIHPPLAPQQKATAACGFFTPFFQGNLCLCPTRDELQAPGIPPHVPDLSPPASSLTLFSVPAASAGLKEGTEGRKRKQQPGDGNGGSSKPFPAQQQPKLPANKTLELIKQR